MGVSQRAKDLPPFIVMDVMERSQALECQGRDVIHLEVGEPDFDTPPAVIEAAARAMREKKTHYTTSLGLPELRQAIAAHYHASYGVTVDPGHVMVTSGTSPAMLFAFAALLDPGDEVIVSDPCYACYAKTIAFCGGQAVRVRVEENDAFQLRPEEIAKRLTPRTSLIIISPATPPAAPLRALAPRELPGRTARPTWWRRIYPGSPTGQGHSILDTRPTASRSTASPSSTP